MGNSVVSRMYQNNSLLHFRYPELVPYLYNRVKLVQPIDDHDYINASWITNENTTDFLGNKTTTYFIASQGPLLETCPHHLSMIYKYNIDLIVTLTKTDKYDSGKLYIYLIAIADIIFENLAITTYFIIKSCFFHRT